MTVEQTHYLAYMLRLWQDQSEADNVWRASLESPHTGERRGFASLESLFEFLRQSTGPSAQSSQPQAQAISERNK